MLKDIKFLKSKLAQKFKNIDYAFQGLIIYINSWYDSEADFINYIKDTVNIIFY